MRGNRSAPGTSAPIFSFDRTPPYAYRPDLAAYVLWSLYLGPGNCYYAGAFLCAKSDGILIG
ncbi:protein of unknown function [Pseudodesulfovibrio profundus]|uniref:Uncharacterized protein n=1 Tax=Pseudodesulfovibrio profundus TaxID=57320 RepID=A0A2C8FBC8_9BACT|nr:protein of unknown function [Pseudodesulfovibrio profundus]